MNASIIIICAIATLSTRTSGTLLQETFCKRADAAISIGKPGREALDSLRQYFGFEPDTIIADESHHPFVWSGAHCEYGDSLKVYFYIHNIHKNKYNMDSILTRPIIGYLVVHGKRGTYPVCAEWKGVEYPLWELSGYKWH